MAKLTIFQQVRELKDWQAVIFAATLVRRMQPNYEFFCELSEFCDASQFNNTLNTVWEWLINQNTKINHQAQIEKIELVTPDHADFDTYGVLPAIDAAISLVALLQLIQGEDQQGAVVVSKLSQGCVEAFIEATSEDSPSSEEIKEHPLMQWEIAFQTELLECLVNEAPSKALVDNLKQMALAEGISNIGIAVHSR